MAADKVLGGSLTGTLTVDPAHLRDLKAARSTPATGDALAEDKDAADSGEAAGSDRKRRIRDAVEAFLADIILLGTEEEVRLAERCARELVSGRPVHTHDLVVSLRDFIRKALISNPCRPILRSRCKAPRALRAVAVEARVAEPTAEWRSGRGRRNSTSESDRRLIQPFG